MNRNAPPSPATVQGRVSAAGIAVIHAVIAIAIVVSAAIAFSHYREELDSHVASDLLFTARIEQQQIIDFLRERVGDSEVLVQRREIRQLLSAAPGSTEHAASLRHIPELVAQFREAYGYHRMLVFDRNENVVYPSGATATIESETVSALKTAQRSGSPSIVDLHKHDESTLRFGIINLVFQNDRLQGSVFLEMDAHPHLYRFIKEIPGSGFASIESLLVRKEGDRAVFLSPLKYAPEIQPLTTYRDLGNSAMMVAKSVESPGNIVRDTVDYRGKSVIGVALPITGTPWLLVTKIDREEAEADVVHLSRIIIALTVIFMLIVTAAVQYFWRAQRAIHDAQKAELASALDESSRQVDSAQRQRSRIEQRFQRIFDASPVAKQIHALDDCRLLAINHAHRQLFGYAPEEISGVDDWFRHAYPDPILRARLRTGWTDQIEKLRRDGGVAVSPELEICCADGSKRTVSGQMAIAGSDIIISWTDLTEIRRGEAALAESERRFRGMVEQTISGFYVEVNHKIAYINPSLENMVGWKLEEVVGRSPGEFVDEQSANQMLEVERRLQAGERTVSLRINGRRRDGSLVPLSTNSTLGSWDGHQAIVAMIEDITERARAEEKIQHYVRQLETSMRSALLAVSKTIDLRDPYTAGHQNRVGQIAGAIAREMGWEQRRSEALELMGLVHDIGKVAVPAEFLTKPTRLSTHEFEIIKTHAQAGYEILKGLEFDEIPVAEIVRQHHERMDGSGYPRGLKGEQILPEARILAVADVLESMASYRPYRPALGLEAAIAEIEKNRGKLYDPVVVDALLRLIRDKAYNLPS